MRTRKKILAHSLILWVLCFSSSAQAFERIVALSPLVSEWTAELLGEVEAKRAIQGVSEYSDYPSFLKSKTQVGPYHQLQVEKIAGLKPDLVLASLEYNRPEQIEQLKRLGLRVEVLEKETFLTMSNWIFALGKILNEPKSAKRIEGEWARGIQYLKKLKAKRSPKRIMIEVQHEPLIVVGGGSYLNEALAAVGYINVFQGLRQGYPKVSKEAVLRENPEEILILDLKDHEEDFKRAMLDWERFQRLLANEKHAIRMIPGSEFARCTPRLLNALKQLN